MEFYLTDMEVQSSKNPDLSFHVFLLSHHQFLSSFMGSKHDLELTIAELGPFPILYPI